MFNWFVAWQIGSQILAGIGSLISGQSTEFSVPISLKGHRFVLTVKIDPATKALTAKLERFR